MSIPPSPSAAPPPDVDLAAEFARLTAEWEDATSHLSSSTAIAGHPAYRTVIALGPAVIPLVLRDLEQTRRHWFEALEALTGTNPVPPADAGRIDRMAAAWLQWGRENGYVW